MLKQGDIIEITEGHKVYADVPEHFVYGNKKGSFKLTHHDVKVGGEFAYLAGQYLVVNTSMDGGGTGHGPHDIYPKGHHVFCEKIDNRSMKIDFYQSGSFTAMIHNIEPVAFAELKWVIPNS